MQCALCAVCMCVCAVRVVRAGRYGRSGRSLGLGRVRKVFAHRMVQISAPLVASRPLSGLIFVLDLRCQCACVCVYLSCANGSVRCEQFTACCVRRWAWTLPLQRRQYIQSPTVPPIHAHNPAQPKPTRPDSQPPTHSHHPPSRLPTRPDPSPPRCGAFDACCVL